MDTIIRDYAYPSEDERFNGIYPSLELEANNSEDIELVEDDGTQSDDDDDEPNWEWQWDYKAHKKENNKDKSGKLFAGQLGEPLRSNLIF
jgi:hypothetical protein